MNILISGATSMIGCKLVNLLSIKHRVYCLVRKDSLKIDRLIKNKNVVLVFCNAENFFKIPYLISENIELGINFFWAGIRGEERNNELIQKNSFDYSVSFLLSCHQLGAKKIIGIGSQAEYGVANLYNESITCHPISFYGIYKYKTLCFYEKFCAEHSINFKWARIFSAFGQYDYAQSLIMTSIEKMKNNKDIYLNSGCQIWNYTYDEDIVYAINLMALDSKFSGVYNLSRCDNLKLVDYIYIVRGILNSLSNISYKSDIKAKQDMIITSTKFNKDFHFEFKYDFHDGIVDMLKRL